MPQSEGFHLPLSLPRRLLCDLAHVARQLPTASVQRCLHLASLVLARERAAPRPGWPALFLKAFALVAVNCPQLRRVYVPFLRPRLYQHPHAVAGVAIERRVGDEDVVFFARIRQPEKLALTDVHARLRRYKEQPLETIATFRRALRLSRLPGPVRRLVWWTRFHASGWQRARLLGTFGVTSLGGFGVHALEPLTPWANTLSYGVVAADGRVDVSLTHDPRVLDAATVARALAELERTLQHVILTELRYLEALDAA